MTDTLPVLVNTRKFVRTQVTSLYNRRLSLSGLSADDRDVKLTQCTTYRDKLAVIDPQIQNLKFGTTLDEADHNLELTTCDEYEAKLACLFTLLKSVAPVASGSNSTIRSLLRSPIAPLPRYESGEDEDLVKFFREFDETTAKHAYTDYDKLQLLKQQVSGHASTLIQSLESDKQEYVFAKELLLKALASEELRRFNAIKQLTELKLSYGSDTYEYVSKMRLLHENFNKLNIDIEHILQYHFWNGLNESFKNHLTLITNQSRPSLKEIEDNFFKANDRYQSSQKAFQLRKNKQLSNKPLTKSTAGMAADVNFKPKYNFIPCSICTMVGRKEADHAMVKCGKYDNANAKLSKLKELGLCSLCTKSGHTSDNCTYKFYKKCKVCQGDNHFYFLCNRSNDASPTVSSHTVTITEAFQSDLGSASILPTFTCNIEGIKVRALKDGGCQSNFVTQKIATDCNLKVIQDNIELTVNGINIAQKYRTKLVEFEISCGHNKYNIKALVLPKIKMALQLENLRTVVQAMVDKGYTLADQDLVKGNDTITNVDFILGSGSGYCVPESEVLFGSHSQSIYSQTSFGIIIKGNIKQILEDLPTLPDLTASTDATCNMKESRNGNYRNCYASANKNFSCLTSSVEVLGYVDSGGNDYCILDREGLLDENELDRATKCILESRCNQYTNVDSNDYNERTAELNDKLVKFALNNTQRENDGRLTMPLLWNSEVAHLLGKNQSLAKVILATNLKRLQKNDVNLKLMSQVFKEQEKAGIIERIDNLDQFLLDHPEHSFLPHMGVFRPDICLIYHKETINYLVL